jgi:hypothetical protein
MRINPGAGWQGKNFASSAESVGGLTCFPGMCATVIACFEIQH